MAQGERENLSSGPSLGRPKWEETCMTVRSLGGLGTAATHSNTSTVVEEVLQGLDGGPNAWQRMRGGGTKAALLILRVSSVIFLPSRGTLRSQRIRT